MWCPLDISMRLSERSFLFLFLGAYLLLASTCFQKVEDRDFSGIPILAELLTLLYMSYPSYHRHCKKLLRYSRKSLCHPFLLIFLLIIKIIMSN